MSDQTIHNVTSLDWVVIDWIGENRTVSASALTWLEWHEELLALRASAEKLKAACEAALDPDDCRLDHHGNCQAHAGCNPCEQKLLREALGLPAQPPPSSAKSPGPTCREFAFAIGRDQSKAMGIPLTDEPLNEWNERRKKADA
jgi:hypothetical protein